MTKHWQKSNDLNYALWNGSERLAEMSFKIWLAERLFLFVTKKCLN